MRLSVVLYSIMERDQLARFAILLRHHLAAEQELFDAGLIEAPTPTEPALATAMPAVTVTADFPLQVLRRTPAQTGETGIKVVGKRQQPGFYIQVRRRETPDFNINLRRRPQ